MRAYIGKSANEVWEKVYYDLVKTPEYDVLSRVGETLEILQCILVIKNPRDRWILSRMPIYNPAYGLVEFVWLFNGDNDGDVLRFWNPKLSNYAGDSKYMHGAYGYRLKHAFGIDQICRAYLSLKSNACSRQIVLQIWDPKIDLPADNGTPKSEDIPCNLTSLLQIRNGSLYWTQISRSNDMIRGVPYDILQFTLLQEFYASWLGCDVGEYVHISNSMHIYKNCLDVFRVRKKVTKKYDGDWGFEHISYEETVRQMTSVYEKIVYVSKVNMDYQGKCLNVIYDIFDPDNSDNKHRPQIIKDILCVIGGDAIRRLGDNKLGLIITNKCSQIRMREASEMWIVNQMRNNNDTNNKECIC
jgi:thymidylate synthase